MRENWFNVAGRLIRERGFNQVKLAEKFGISPGAFNHWMRGRREPKFEVILQILHQLGLRNINFDEHGNVIVSAASYESAIYFNQETAPPQDASALTNMDETPVPYPIFATRTEIEALPNITENHRLFLTGKTPIRGCGFWNKISTEAMSAPQGASIPEGSYVLFDTGITPRDGSLGLFYSPTSPALLFRQLHVEAGCKHLKGLNPKWPTVPLPRNTKCLGVAVELRLFFGAKNK